MQQVFRQFFLPILVLCSFPGVIKAQSYGLELQSVDNNLVLLQKLVDAPPKFDDATAAYAFVSRIVPSLQEKGYLAASMDSLDITAAVYRPYIFLGKQYKWAHIGLDSIPGGILVQAAVARGQWEGTIVSSRRISRLTEQLLEWNENNGYPFARVWLDQVAIDSNGGVKANLRMDRGRLHKIDTVIINGDIRISRSFLLQYLGLSQGEPYNEKKLRAISIRLKELPFLQEAAPWTVEFGFQATRLNLYLKEKKANQLNGIVGLLPNSSETGKFLLTVDALFAFQNILGNGESMTLSYQNLQYRSPRLKADIVWPYLFNTPVGVDGHFDLYKKDTSFRRTSIQLGVRYQLTAMDYVRVFYQNQSNRLITVDTAAVRSKKQLPDNVDIVANGAGVEIGLNRTDYRINPRRGWEARLSTTALLRKISRNDEITGLTDGSGFDYATLYDSLEARKYQYFINGGLSYYAPVGRKMVLKAAYSLGWISGQHLFRNELYQLGGFRLLRGFDEQSIYASQYHVVSLELRMLLDQNSYFYFFSDNGYVQSAFNGFYREGFYNGFGLGTTLETKSGLFSISYGLGRSEDNPLRFRQSKIHFGYAAFF